MTKGCPRRLEIRKESMDLMVAEPVEYEVRDTKLQGFGVRVSPKGLRTFVFRWSLAGGDGRKTIGHFPALPVAAARKKAEGWFGMVARGEDPRTEDREKKAAKLALADAASKTMTMADLIERFELESLPKKAASTQRDYKRVLKHLKARFGKEHARTFGLDPISAMHAEMADRPREANKRVHILSAVLTDGEKWKMRDLRSNPCYLIELYPENERVRSLTAEEARTLGGILRRMADKWPVAVDMIWMMLLTGARPIELRRLEWDWVNLEAGIITIPRTRHKTGKKTREPRYIGLGPHALAILKRYHKARRCKWVFPNSDGTAGYGGIDTFWQRMRRKDPERPGELAKAGLMDFRIYDLRHTWATWARKGGIDLSDLPDMLGHTNQRMSRRYAHAQPDLIRSGAKTVERDLGKKAMRQKPKGKQPVMARGKS